jgi:hypothetical protein
MTLYQQRRVVAVSSMVVFTVGTLSRLDKGAGWLDQDAARFYIGVGMAFTFVSLFTDLGLEVGAGFALLIMVASLMRQGDDVFRFINRRARKTSPRSIRRRDRRRATTFRTSRGEQRARLRSIRTGQPHLPPGTLP